MNLASVGRDGQGKYIYFLDCMVKSAHPYERPMRFQ